MSRSHIVGLLVIILLVSSGCWWVMNHSTTLGYDDAYISFRYAQNLVNGEGLVFNPGERVEGYSNLLYVLMLAPITRLVSEDAVYPAAVTLNALAIIVAAWTITRMPRGPSGTPWRWSAAFLVAANPLLWHAAWTAMETGIVVLGFVWLWWAVAHCADAKSKSNYIALVLAAVACVLIRADGFILAGIAVTFLAIKGQWKAFAAGIAAIGVTFGALTLWRMSYYGLPMPNTYYAKVSGALIDRLAFAWSMFSGARLDVMRPTVYICAGALIVCLLIAVANRRNPLRVITFEAWLAPLWICYWFYVGGDIFFHRFLVILVPLAAFIVAYRLAPYSGNRTLIVAIAAVMFYYPAMGHRILKDDIHYDTWIILGKHFKETFPGETIAVDAAGKMPYYSHLTAIDTLGLTDAHIAQVEADVFLPGHNKHDWDYVFDRNPAVITSWIGSLKLDLGEYMPRERYLEAGYKIAYVVYLRHGSAREGPFIDVRGMDEAEIAKLLVSGYDYAVLVRNDLADGLPALPPWDAHR